MKTITREEELEIIRLHVDEKMGAKPISKRVNRSNNTVRRILLECGVYDTSSIVRTKEARENSSKAIKSSWDGRRKFASKKEREEHYKKTRARQVRRGSSKFGSDEHRGKMSQIARDRWSNPSSREYASEKMREHWVSLKSDEEKYNAFREKLSEGQKKAWRENKALNSEDWLYYISSRGGGRKSVFNSKKSNAYIKCSSSWEHRACEILEDNPDVLYFRRAKSIPYKLDGEDRRYIPDFYVEKRDGSREIIEVKPSRLLGHRMNVEKFRYAQDFCYNNGLTFSVWTEREIMSDSELQNGQHTPLPIGGPVVQGIRTADS